MKKFCINVRYFLAPLLIVAALFGVLAGGPWVWSGVVLLGMGMIVDTLTKARTPGAGLDQEGETYGIVPLLNGTMYGMLGIFVLLQLALAWRIWQYVNGVPIGETTLLGMSVQDGITSTQLFGAVLSTGIFAGLGIIYGHELAHTKGFSFVIARRMMAFSGTAHFCSARRPHPAPSRLRRSCAPPRSASPAPAATSASTSAPCSRLTSAPTSTSCAMSPCRGSSSLCPPPKQY